jgi:hypothetical protein
MKRLSLVGVLFVSGLALLSARARGPATHGGVAEGAAVQAPAAATDAPVLNVISTGAAPKTALRYNVPATYKEHMDATTMMSMSMDMGGMSMPAMSMPGIKVGADLTVTNVSSAGDVTYSMAFTGLDLVGGDPSIAGTMQGSMPDLKSVQGTATISNRGVTRKVDMDLSKINDSAVAQLMGTMSEQLKNVALQLPEEPVGVGAHWQVKTSQNGNGVAMSVTTDYELVSFDGKTASLKTKTDMSAPPQAVSNPALPPGSDVRLEKMTGAGTGTVSIALAGLVPTSESSLDMTMVMDLNMGGQAQTMSMTNSIKTSIGPRK